VLSVRNHAAGHYGAKPGNRRGGHPPSAHNPNGGLEPGRHSRLHGRLLEVDSLVFIGRKGPTYGWQQTLDNYKKNYPDAAAMGQLDFSGLRVTLVAPTAAQVVGRWHLARPAAGDLQGYFLLVLRQIDGKWVVVADHTNSE
jgi:hypothetical protein